MPLIDAGTTLSGFIFAVESRRFAGEMNRASTSAELRFSQRAAAETA